MARYLLTCNCGKPVPVEVGQAGGHVVCLCGTTLDVPALRRLRELPPESIAQDVAKRAWRPRDGVAAAFVICAVLLAATSLWITQSQPKPPTFDPDDALKGLTGYIDSMTPSAAWEWWVSNGERLQDGFQVYEYRLFQPVEQQVIQNRFVAKCLLIVAGVAVASAIVVALWPAASSRTKGDGETRS